MLVALGLTGFVSSVALLTIASNRIPETTTHHVTTILLVIQWHAVGLTLSKCGIDYALFAIVSRHTDTTYRERDVLLIPVLPCVLCFLLTSLFLFPAELAILISLAVLVDTLATFRIAFLNAKRRFYSVAIGNLLNYPLFALIWFGIAQLVSMSIAMILALFLLSSACRYWWLAVRSSSERSNAQAITLMGKVRFGAQGALNLGLFRSDQIALAIAVFAGGEWLSGGYQLGQYVFLARFPEIASGILVLVGMVYFPTYHVVAPNTDQQESTKRIFWIYLFGALVALVIGILAITLGRYIYRGPLPSVSWCAPFALQIPLILIANLITYSMQSQGYLPILLRNLAVSAGAGVFVLTASIAIESLYMLAWTIPVQLLVFLVLGYGRPWGVPSRQFEVVSD